MRIVPFVLSVLGVLAVFLSGCMNVIDPDTDEECKPITRTEFGEILVSYRLKDKDTSKEKGVVFRKYSNDESMIEIIHKNKEHKNKKLLLGKFGDIFYGLDHSELNDKNPFILIGYNLYLPMESLKHAFPRFPCDIPREETIKKFFTSNNYDDFADTRNEKYNISIELTTKRSDNGIIEYTVHYDDQDQIDFNLDGYLNLNPISPLQDDYDLSGWKHHNGDAITDSLGALRRTLRRK